MMARFFRKTREVDPNMPDVAWDGIKKSQHVVVVKPLSFDTPKPPNHTRFVCISDTHSHTRHLKVPDGDVLLHTGDFTTLGKLWEVRRFKEFLLSLSHSHKIVIAGNHDHTFDVDNYDHLKDRFGLVENCHEVRKILIEAPGIVYLEDSGTVINGINIWGSPWQPWFNDWAFNLPRGNALQKKWDKIPGNTDVLMTHGPALGHGDRCYNGSRVGCYNLLMAIQNRVKPRYHVFGHVHEDYGITADTHTVYINAATCDFDQIPSNKPIIFDLPNQNEPNTVQLDIDTKIS